MYLNVPPEYCFTEPADAFEKRSADFVIIATPTPLHERLLELTLTWDFNVLIEAPLTDSMESALRIYANVKRHRRKVAVASPQRYDQDKQTLLRLVQSNRFGRLNYLVARYTENNRRSPTWGRSRHEMDNPLLIEAACQHLDVFRAIAGANARTVFTASWNPPWGEYRGDSTALVTLEMENGVHCFYEGAKANGASLNDWNNEYFRAECEQAAIELDRRQVRILRNPAFEEPKIEQVNLLTQPTWGSVWLTQMFCESLREGTKQPNTLKDHVRCMTMIFAAIESARTGKIVDVRAFLRRHIDAAKDAEASAGADPL